MIVTMYHISYMCIIFPKIYPINLRKLMTTPRERPFYIRKDMFACQIHIYVIDWLELFNLQVYLIVGDYTV